MKPMKVWPFEKLLDYVEGIMDPAERQQLEHQLECDEELGDMLEGIRLICTDENMDRAELESILELMARQAEKTIQLHFSFSNHLIELNQQLRAAAAIFLLIFPFSMLFMGAVQTGSEIAQTFQPGPYDLAFGMKIAP